MSTYATSTVKLYYVSTSARWDLLPNKLFVIEDIESYLATKTVKTVLLFQYIKQELETSITVDLSQTYAEPLSTSYKYVSIKNSDTNKTYYYFVKNVYWRSKSSVRFDLVMDVLNTFKENTDYTFKENTRVIREHKDRFIAVNTNIMNFIMSNLNDDTLPNVDDYLIIYTYPDLENLGKIKITAFDQMQETMSGEIIIDSGLTSMPENTNITAYIEDEGNPPIHSFTATVNSYNFDKAYFRKIDYVNENINPLLQCGNSNGVLIQNNKTLLQDDWYLLYRNQNDPSDSLVNPVECYLMPKESKDVIASAITGGKITPSALQESYYYYMDLNTETITLDNGTTLSKSAIYDMCVIIKKNEDNTINVLCVEGTPNAVLSNDVLLVKGSWDCEYLTIDTMPMAYKYSTSRPTGSLNNIYSQMASGTAGQFDNNLNIENINGINDLDRTEAKNIKLIKLPYCPYDFTITSSKIDISNDSNWDCVVLGNLMVLKLNDLSTNLRTTLSLTTSDKEPLPDLKVNINPSINDTRLGDSYESKLYHSEFYRPSYVYDSFTYAVQLEKLNIASYYSSQNFTVYFDMTKTINSRFMFTFNSLVFNLANESYAKYMPIIRNNEEVLYNVPYINYIRNGFNYDVKAKNLSNTSAWAGVALSGVSIGASLLAPTVPLKVAGIVASVVSLAVSFKNAIVSTIQNEESLQRKITETKNQTSSVSGSDDVDLMSIYAENRLKYLVYQPSPVMKEMLYKLFFYGGYYSNRMGLPNHETRVNFDYLEADVSLENIANIPNDCLEELINCFKNGATYIHKTTRANKWDLEQEYENWERSLL